MVLEKLRKAGPAQHTGGYAQSQYQTHTSSCTPVGSLCRPPPTSSRTCEGDMEVAMPYAEAGSGGRVSMEARRASICCALMAFWGQVYSRVRVLRGCGLAGGRVSMEAHRASICCALMTFWERVY